MSNPFRDQEKFMRACDQSVDAMNESQYALYKSLIAEEFRELQEAHDMEAELDALIDNTSQANLLNEPDCTK